jgi:osmotically-inducible protein OsmY
VAVAALLIAGRYDTLKRVLQYVLLVFLAYVVTAFVARPNWAQVLQDTVVPHLSVSSDYVAGALALLGTTLTSYAYVWQTIEAAEERLPLSRLGLAQLDAGLGMVVAGIIFYFPTWLTCFVALGPALPRRDEIAVRLPSAAQRTDADIAAAARRALEADADVPVEKIDITVSNGMVTLRGEVDWSYQMKDAERVVRRLTGVRGVVNLLTVRPQLRPSPAQLKQEIESALVHSAETDAHRIPVEVRAWAEREEAERVAWRGAGVTRVDNRITIKLD